MALQSPCDRFSTWRDISIIWLIYGCTKQFDMVKVTWCISYVAGHLDCIHFLLDRTHQSVACRLSQRTARNGCNTICDARTKYQNWIIKGKLNIYALPLSGRIVSHTSKHTATNKRTFIFFVVCANSWTIVCITQAHVSWQEASIRLWIIVMLHKLSFLQLII